MATFNGSESGPLPLPTAKQWAENYRATIKKGDTLAHYFGGQIVERVLNQPEAVGIRVYYAIDDTGKKQLLIVGVDANGENLLPEEGLAARDGDGRIIVDFSQPCPTVCPSNGL